MRFLCVSVWIALQLLKLAPGCRAALLLNDSFFTLDNWIEDINGATGVIQLQPMDTAADPTVPHNVYTNITRCPGSPSACYRAEVATVQSLRPILFPNCTVEYWLGFSSILPASWDFDETGDSLIYNFQLHGIAICVVIQACLNCCVDGLCRRYQRWEAPYSRNTDPRQHNDCQYMWFDERCQFFLSVLRSRSAYPW